VKISFCITCKDRLFQLSQTLPYSLSASSNYTNKEFILLDYNSNDGLYFWAKSHLKYWEKQGTIKYIKTNIPKYFCAAHAKNIAHKHATGDIVCNLDADNFVTTGFCEQLVSIFKENNRNFFYSASIDAFQNHGCCGKIAVRKEHFLNVNGYDESQYLGWGWDDVNFKYRTKNYNNLIGIEGDLKHNLVLFHNNQQRTANFPCKDLKKTRNLSIERIKQIDRTNDFIANKDINWGFVEDLKIGLDN